jgi:hypothetical protein
MVAEIAGPGDHVGDNPVCILVQVNIDKKG